MLSSCWLTSPFSGCFNTAIRGAVGGGHESSDAGNTRARMNQPPPSTEKNLANGSAGGLPPAGISSGGGRGVSGGVTTIAPKSSNQESQPPPSSDQQENPQQDNQQQPQTPPMETEMDGDDKFMKRTYKSEYRKKFRPFSQYQYVDGKFHKSKTEGDTGNAWYKEVLELRRQAGQYRCRGWGVETASDRMAEIYNKQVELWEQVSRRSSLQALSLASATPSRPISKAEKEIENSRRSSPIKHVRDRPSTAPSKPKPAPVHKPADKIDGKPQKETTPRHHYDKTTGGGDGFLITSPSRDRIEPIVNTDWSTRRSPRKTPPITSPIKDGVAKRRPPRAISVARTSSTKENKAPNKSSSSLGKTIMPSTTAGKKSDGGRSVSVGPENRSPKRTSRPPSSTHAQVPSTKTERRPRPTSLSTSSRRKGADSAIPHHEAKKPTKKPHDISASPKRSSDLKSRDEKRQSSEEEPKEKDKKKDEKDDKEGKEIIKESLRDSAGRKSTPEPRFDPEKYEPVVKTPPEPTRVKSPDQVMVKSPDPVNWTVPLDTGKTFTVTHNIPEGEASRGTPSSEHRPPLESRSRQTPEPTRVYQGSLAGTPITTAGTGSAAPSATTATATASAPQLPTKTESVPTAKTTAPAASVPTTTTTTTTVPTTTVPADKPKEPVSGDQGGSETLPSSEIKPSDKEETKEPSSISTDKPEPSSISTDKPEPSSISTDKPEPSSISTDKPEPSSISTDKPEPSSISTAAKSIDSKPLSSIKETSPQPTESSKPYQEMPKPSEVVESKTSPASSIPSSVGLSSGILPVVGSLDTNISSFTGTNYQSAYDSDALLTVVGGEEIGGEYQLSGKLVNEHVEEFPIEMTEKDFNFNKPSVDTSLEDISGELLIIDQEESSELEDYKQKELHELNSSNPLKSAVSNEYDVQHEHSLVTTESEDVKNSRDEKSSGEEDLLSYGIDEHIELSSAQTVASLECSQNKLYYDDIKQVSSSLIVQENLGDESVPHTNEPSDNDNLEQMIPKDYSPGSKETNSGKVEEWNDETSFYHSNKDFSDNESEKELKVDYSSDTHDVNSNKYQNSDEEESLFAKESFEKINLQAQFSKNDSDEPSKEIDRYSSDGKTEKERSMEEYSSDIRDISSNKYDHSDGEISSFINESFAEDKVEEPSEYDFHEHNKEFDSESDREFNKAEYRSDIPDANSDKNIHADEEASSSLKQSFSESNMESEFPNSDFDLSKEADKHLSDNESEKDLNKNECSSDIHDANFDKYQHSDEEISFANESIDENKSQAELSQYHFDEHNKEIDEHKSDGESEKEFNKAEYSSDIHGRSSDKNEHSDEELSSSAKQFGESNVEAEFPNNDLDLSKETDKHLSDDESEKEFIKAEYSPDIRGGSPDKNEHSDEELSSSAKQKQFGESNVEAEFPNNDLDLSKETDKHLSDDESEHELNKAEYRSDILDASSDKSQHSDEEMCSSEKQSFTESNVEPEFFSNVFDTSKEIDKHLSDDESEKEFNKAEYKSDILDASPDKNKHADEEVSSSVNQSFRESNMESEFPNNDFDLSKETDKHLSDNESEKDLNKDEYSSDIHDANFDKYQHSDEEISSFANESIDENKSQAEFSQYHFDKHNKEIDEHMSDGESEKEFNKAEYSSDIRGGSSDKNEHSDEEMSSSAKQFGESNVETEFSNNDFNLSKETDKHLSDDESEKEFIKAEYSPDIRGGSPDKNEHSDEEMSSSAKQFGESNVEAEFPNNDFNLSKETAKHLSDDESEKEFIKAEYSPDIRGGSPDKNEHSDEEMSSSAKQFGESNVETEFSNNEFDLSEETDKHLSDNESEKEFIKAEYSPDIRVGISDKYEHSDEEVSAFKRESFEENKFEAALSKCDIDVSIKGTDNLNAVESDKELTKTGYNSDVHDVDFDKYQYSGEEMSPFAKESFDEYNLQAELSNSVFPETRKERTNSEDVFSDSEDEIVLHAQNILDNDNIQDIIHKSEDDLKYSDKTLAYNETTKDETFPVKDVLSEHDILDDETVPHPEHFTNENLKDEVLDIGYEKGLDSDFAKTSDDEVLCYSPNSAKNDNLYGELSKTSDASQNENITSDKFVRLEDEMSLDLNDPLNYKIVREDLLNNEYDSFNDEISAEEKIHDDETSSHKQPYLDYKMAQDKLSINDNTTVTSDQGICFDDQVPSYVQSDLDNDDFDKVQDKSFSPDNDKENFNEDASSYGELSTHTQKEIENEEHEPSDENYEKNEDETFHFEVLLESQNASNDVIHTDNISFNKECQERNTDDETLVDDRLFLDEENRDVISEDRFIQSEEEINSLQEQISENKISFQTNNDNSENDATETVNGLVNKKVSFNLSQNLTEDVLPLSEKSLSDENMQDVSFSTVGHQNDNDGSRLDEKHLSDDTSPHPHKSFDDDGNEDNESVKVDSTSYTKEVETLSHENRNSNDDFSLQKSYDIKDYTEMTPSDAVYVTAEKEIDFSEKEDLANEVFETNAEHLIKDVANDDDDFMSHKTDFTTQYVKSSDDDRLSHSEESLNNLKLSHSQVLVDNLSTAQDHYEDQIDFGNQLENQHFSEISSVREVAENFNESQIGEFQAMENTQEREEYTDEIVNENPLSLEGVLTKDKPYDSVTDYSQEYDRPSSNEQSTTSEGQNYINLLSEAYSHTEQEELIFSNNDDNTARIQYENLPQVSSGMETLLASDSAELSDKKLEIQSEPILNEVINQENLGNYTLQSTYNANINELESTKISHDETSDVDTDNESLSSENSQILIAHKTDLSSPDTDPFSEINENDRSNEHFDDDDNMKLRHSASLSHEDETVEERGHHFGEDDKIEAFKGYELDEDSVHEPHKSLQLEENSNKEISLNAEEKTVELEKSWHVDFDKYIPEEKKNEDNINQKDEISDDIETIESFGDSKFSHENLRSSDDLLEASNLSVKEEKFFDEMSQNQDFQCITEPIGPNQSVPFRDHTFPLSGSGGVSESLSQDLSFHEVNLPTNYTQQNINNTDEAHEESDADSQSISKDSGDFKHETIEESDSEESSTIQNSASVFDSEYKHSVIENESIIESAFEFRSDDPILFKNSDLKFEPTTSPHEIQNPFTITGFANWSDINADGNGLKHDDVSSYKNQNWEEESSALSYSTYSHVEDEKNPFGSFVDDIKENSETEKVMIKNPFETDTVSAQEVTPENDYKLKNGYEVNSHKLVSDQYHNENGMHVNPNEYSSWDSNDSMVIHDGSSTNSQKDEKDDESVYSNITDENMQESFQKGKVPQRENSFVADPLPPTTTPWHIN